MKLRFLCGPHRLEISHQPKMAMYSWQHSMDTAQNLCDQNRYKEALPYLGSAFEIAEIIMTARSVDVPKAGELFTTSAVLLAGTFARLDYTAQSLEIYWMVINRLERELSISGSSQGWVNQYLAHFYESVQSSDFTGNNNNFVPASVTEKAVHYSEVS